MKNVTSFLALCFWGRVIWMRSKHVTECCGYSYNKNDICVAQDLIDFIIQGKLMFINIVSLLVL